MSLEKTIEETKKQEARKGRFSGTIAVHSSNQFSGQIDTKTLSQIEVTYDPEYEERVQGREKPQELIESSGKNGTKIIVSDVIAHEINHRGYGDCIGCPGKGGEEGFRVYLDSFVEPISEVLIPRGYTSFQDFHNFANQVQDLIANTQLRHTAERDNLGLALFYENSASINGLTPHFDAFLRTQMVCWGDLEQARMLYDYSKEQREKVLEVKREFLRRIGFNGKSRRQLAEILNTPEKWPRIAKIFAEEFSKLTQPGITSIPLIGNRRFKGEIRDRDVMARYVYGRYASKEKAPSFLSRDDSLILLYEQLAKRLDIKIETKTISEEMPMVHYGQRPFDPKKDKPKRLKLGISEQGDLEIRTTKHSIDYPIAVKQSPKGFPEFRVAFIDASDSTRHSPSCLGCSGYSCSGSKEFIPWGDKSIYHYELLSVSGILEFLRQNGLLRKQTFRAGAFSSGFESTQGLEDSKRLLIHPEFGGTVLYEDGINQVFSSNGNLVFTMSDGEVFNWTRKLTKNPNSEEDENEKRTTRDYYVERAKNHHYFHMHFGIPNQFTRDLETAQLPVFYMTEGDDFVRKAIELTRRIYRK